MTALLDVLVLYINTTSYPTHKLAYHMQQICRFCKKMLLVYHIQVHCMLSQENSIIVDSVKTQFIINNFVGNTHLTDIRFMWLCRHLTIVFGVLMYFDWSPPWDFGFVIPPSVLILPISWYVHSLSKGTVSQSNQSEVSLVSKNSGTPPKALP